MNRRDNFDEGRRPGVGTRISLMLAFLFLVAAIMLVYLINHEMKHLALEDAKAETRHFLDHNLAIHTYFTHQLKPTLFSAFEKHGIDSGFQAEWMSSTYAVREITKYSEGLNDADYYYKECAINARSPENEADDYENAFIRELNNDPQLMERSEVREIDDAWYLMTLRRGESMEASCIVCHSRPEAAPAGLVERYGDTRSFNREVGEVVSAISVRIPLVRAYRLADDFSIKLSGVLLGILLLLFAGQFLLSQRMLYTPLAAIQRKAVDIAGDAERLGESVPVPRDGDLKNLAEAFNVMSVNLRDERQQLERRVRERTSELTATNNRLEEEIAQRRQVEEDLRISHRITEALVNAPLDTAILLSVDGEVLAINAIGAERFQMQPAQMIGKTIYQYFSAEVAEVRRRVIGEVGETGEWQRLVDERDGITYESGFYPVKDSEGRVIQVAVYARDITDMVKAEAAVRDAERRKAELAAIRMTAATSAHEINNPLMGITGSLQLLRETAESGDDRELINNALSAAQRIRKVINDLEQIKDPQYRAYHKDKQILDID